MAPAKSKITDGTYSSVETLNPLTDAIKIGAVPEKILADEYPRNNIWASQSAQDLQNSGENLPENNRTFFDDGLRPTTFDQLLFGCSSRTTHLHFWPPSWDFFFFFTSNLLIMNFFSSEFPISYDRNFFIFEFLNACWNFLKDILIFYRKFEFSIGYLNFLLENLNLKQKVNFESTYMSLKTFLPSFPSLFLTNFFFVYL